MSDLTTVHEHTAVRTYRVSPMSSLRQECFCGAGRWRNHGPWSPWAVKADS